ncbi:unnamed protein product [Triticum turgidum subsp. durum]|uniref:Uncharacterized protein n=1 Tax=Triticum turgidum subsp. durum TaxID=4567 RepID=A0A9R0Q346_TRITD|nr:unnamed protein product [Triticum turgidum subsp. durum]
MRMKYVVLAPWVAHGIQQVATKGWREADLGYLVILPSMILRGLHNQAWITVSRLQNARGKRQIVDRGIEFEQIDRERNWDDQIILSAILLFLGALHLPGGQNLPLWRTDGAVLLALLHAGPVEFLYYWFHRALHHHFLYTRYHSHHHASIVTEPITCKYVCSYWHNEDTLAAETHATTRVLTNVHVCASTVCSDLVARYFAACAVASSFYLLLEGCNIC